MYFSVCLPYFCLNKPWHEFSVEVNRMATGPAELAEKALHHSNINVLLIGQHELFLVALRALIQTEPSFIVVGTASWNNAAAMACVKPDVIVMDLQRGEDGSLDLLANL